MGPPSEDGGNDIEALAYCYREVWLQWGRRPRTAEISQVFTGSHARRMSFNGAAVRGRRKCRTFRTNTYATLCFNGAAVRGRRKSMTCPSTPCAPPEASMGPPSEDGGNLPAKAGSIHAAELQWGRRPRTAEISTMSEDGVAAILLQWGRRQRTAEIQECSGCGGVVAKLQWGRRPRTAEMAHSTEWQ